MSKASLTHWSIGQRKEIVLRVLKKFNFNSEIVYQNLNVIYYWKRVD